MKQLLKSILSPQLRLDLRVAYIGLQDVLKSFNTKFVQSSTAKINEGAQLQPLFYISQPIKKTQYSDNKVANIQLALQHIHNLVIQPQEVFSFWRLVGQPTEKRGFKEGRAILGDALSADFGGGLCQLSGMLYYLAIQADLHIIERHTHSFDLYTEESRYTPLGSDATVAYGYKDLRFSNPFQQPVCFRFDVQETKINAWLCATQPLPMCEIVFDVEVLPEGKRVKSYRLKEGKERTLIENMFYKNYQAKGL